MLEFTAKEDNPEKPKGKPIEHSRNKLEDLIATLHVARWKKEPPAPAPKEAGGWGFRLIMLFPKHRGKGYAVHEEQATLFLGSYRDILRQCEQFGGKEVDDIELLGCVLTESGKAPLIEEVAMTMQKCDMEEVLQSVVQPRDWIYLGLLTQESHQDVVEICRISKRFDEYFRSRYLHTSEV